ncbi:hypothetical protein BDW75DRAFT_246308 [Aspergillus navahoensis]
MPLAVYDDISQWGQLPAEQYLIRHWNHASAEPAEQQRTRLIQEFLKLDNIAEELDPTGRGVHPEKPWSRVPTAEEIVTILQPWRPEQIRWRACKLWRDERDVELPLLRIHYDPKDDERVKSWTNLSENYSDVSYLSILNDRDLFNFEPGSQTQIQIQVELSKTASGYSRVDIDEAGPEGAFLRKRRADVKSALDTVKKDHSGWRNDLNILITGNYPALALLHYVSCAQILIADKETFETNQLLYVHHVHLDGKQNITMQGRIEFTAERLDQIAGDEVHREMPGDVWEEGSVGEGFRIGGHPGQELFQWTKQDLEDDPKL